MAILKGNIEEGFADSFCLHLMCLKYPEHQSFPLLQAHMKAVVAPLKSDQVSDIDIHRIYGLLPLSKDGLSLTDISEVVDRCWEAALQNNEEMLLSKMTENPYFKHEVMKAINASTDIPTGIATQFHQQVMQEGFDTRGILSVRGICLDKRQVFMIQPA